MKNCIHSIAIAGLIAFVAAGRSARASNINESDLFPFKYHLTYPKFETDLNQISHFVSTICTLKDSALAPEVKSAYADTCAFPQLLQMLRQNVQVADGLFANGTIVTRDEAQFIDMEYGWIIQDPYSLADQPTVPLLNVILIRRALQMSVRAMETLWLIQGHRESISGRFFLLPEFAGGLERDVILVRDLEYARTIQCIDQGDVVEGQCIDRRTAISKALNELLGEYQAKSISVDPLIRLFAEASERFRMNLAEWFAAHDSANAVMESLLRPDDRLNRLRIEYNELVQMNKRVRSPEVSKVAVALDFQRYVREQSLIHVGYSDWLKKNDPQLTPDIVAILALARKQLDIYYKQ